MKIKTPLLIILFCLFFVNIASADSWASDSSIVTGLGYPASDTSPEVFYMSSDWYLISGEIMGVFYGYRWTGSTWVSDSSIISGLAFHTNGFYSTPTVFNDSGTWKLIYGDYNGNFYGYYRSGSTWIEDSGIVSGLSVAGYAKAAVFNDSGTLKLITGVDSGQFTGFYWSGAAWVGDSSIVSGLGDIGSVSAPEVYYKDDTWHLIAGESAGVFNGFYWNGTSWISDSSIVNGLTYIGNALTLTVYDDTGTWKLIAGEGSNDGFTGFVWVLAPPDPVSLSSDVSYTWVNWTWSAGSDGLNTDSYNVSINDEWTNGSTNTYYNHYLPSGGTSTIIVFAYNSSNDVLSIGSVTDSETTPISPYNPPDPINLGNSTYNFHTL